MNEKEMLELAAKAAGYYLRHEQDGSITVWLDNGPDIIQWNPLTDDGDAFRLMVRLGMEVYIDNHPDGCQCVEVESHTHKVGRFIQLLTNHDDHEAATRYAIFACAAEIGKAMP